MTSHLPSGNKKCSRKIGKMKKVLVGLKIKRMIQLKTYKTKTLLKRRSCMNMTLTISESPHSPLKTRAASIIRYLKASWSATNNSLFLTTKEFLLWRKRTKAKLILMHEHN